MDDEKTPSASVTFTKTFEDYATAQRLHAKWGKKKWLAMGGLSLVFFVAGAAAWFGVLPSWLDPIASIAAFAFFGGWIGGLFGRFAISPMMWKKTFATSKLFRTPCECSWNSAGFRTSNEFGNSTVPWDRFLKIKRNSQILLLYVARNQFIPIPRRTFSNEASFTDLGDRAEEAIAKQADVS
jgi:hypothetical protein